MKKTRTQYKDREFHHQLWLWEKQMLCSAGKCLLPHGLSVGSREVSALVPFLAGFVVPKAVPCISFSLVAAFHQVRLPECGCMALLCPEAGWNQPEPAVCSRAAQVPLPTASSHGSQTLHMFLKLHSSCCLELCWRLKGWVKAFWSTCLCTSGPQRLHVWHATNQTPQKEAKSLNKPVRYTQPTVPCLLSCLVHRADVVCDRAARPVSVW